MVVVSLVALSPKGIVKLRLTAVSDPQHGGFTAGSSPASWGSIDELFVNLTAPALTLRMLFHLPLRQTEGFVASLLRLMAWT